MLPHKPKSRMISIRLSDDDYTRMKSRCGEFASISDFMRDAILRALSGANGPGASSVFEMQVTQLGMRLDSLEQKVNELMACLGLLQSGHVTNGCCEADFWFLRIVIAWP